MRTAEKNLLLAVRNILRLPQPTGGGFSEKECDVEYDANVAPATSSDHYIVVTANGWQPGPRHGTSGGVNDLVYSVDVTAVRRSTSTPRDRTRGIALTNLGSLADEMDLIFQAIDWKYEVTTLAETLIAAEGAAPSSGQGFVHPLVVAGMDPKPRPCPASVFGGAEGLAAGLMRTIHFSGARRITTKA
jgi:hypothetical protein